MSETTHDKTPNEDKTDQLFMDQLRSIDDFMEEIGWNENLEEE